MEARDANLAQDTPTLHPTPVESTHQNETIPTSQDATIQPPAAQLPGSITQLSENQLVGGSPNANDNELFIAQEPFVKRPRLTPRLTNAEIRASVRVGLDNTQGARIPKSSHFETLLRPVNNGSDKEKKGPKKSRANELDVTTLRGSDIIADAQISAASAPIPISAQSKKDQALSDLIHSLPKEARSDAMPDKKLVIDATKKFTKKPRVDRVGGWKHVNLESSLYHHQVLGAAFMREREKSTELPRGGMLCDVMGLGKTIQTLANIVDGEYEKLEDNANTTLIVAPRGLIDHWLSQIQRHVRNDFLRPVIAFHAGSRIDSLDTVESLLGHKVVLTTYDEIRMSYPKMQKPSDMPPEELLRWGMKVFKENSGPLHQIRFRRIILDEGQVIRNPDTQTSIAIRALHAHYKWILSGTPLLNHCAEFWAYFNFLGVPDIGNFSNFVRNFCSGSDLANQRLLNLVHKIVFRRTHSSRLFSCPIVKLPSLGEEVVRLKPLAIESAIHEMIVDSFVTQLNSLVEHVDQQRSCFLTMLLRLRMLNSHLLCVQENLKYLLQSEKNMAILQRAVADSSGNEADINRDIYVQLEELIEATKAAKAAKAANSQEADSNPLSLESMFTAYKSGGDDYNYSCNEGTDWIAIAGDKIPSSKVMKTWEIIGKWFQDAPDTKVVIFTQFRAMTTILTKMCRKEKWPFAMLVGNMDFASRTQSLQEFQTDPDIKIMIASLKAGGVGLDITAANKCILIDPWWNDAIQQQAFCRLFRIGQQRNVEIVKLVVQESIDDYMLRLQIEKLKEIEGAIGPARLPSVSETDLLPMLGKVKQVRNGGIQIDRPSRQQ